MVRSITKTSKLWLMNQEPEDLFETISQTLLNSVDRDALSGWGAVVRIMYVLDCLVIGSDGRLQISTHDKVITRTLRSRMD
jgi:20S proteasome subunit beta 3